jgi:hypothetical protein
LLFLVLTFAGTSRADAVADARRLSADPDNEALGIGWSGHLRGQLGGVLPAWGDDDTSAFTLRVPAMVELYNEINNVVPNNYWRGIISLEVGYHRPASSRVGSRAAVTFEIHHESDHETVDLLRYYSRPIVGDSAPVGYLQLNTAGIRVDLPVTIARQQFVFTVLPRVHVLSCTANLVLCANGTEGWGSQSFESFVQAVWTGGAEAPVPGRLRPFASLAGDWILPSALIREETRLTLNAGIWIRTQKRGAFQFFFAGWLGNDVGYHRERNIALGGVGFRWTPYPSGG